VKALNIRTRSYLPLKAGEWVRVRRREDILATLDHKGCLGNLPFMPEMLEYCGKKLRVGKRADKTCDPAHVPWSIRRLKRCVHLEGVRCDGGGHGGCEAGCLIFWREEWLERTTNQVLVSDLASIARPENELKGQFCPVEVLWESAKRLNSSGQEVYSCQATDLRKFSSPMRWWDLRQYVRDINSGNLSNGLGSSTTERLLDFALNVLRILQTILISVVRQRGITYPETAGQTDKTPTENLNLQPGEFVQVLSKEEILATLDRKSKNRGLLFGPEMLQYCGGVYRVLRRVDHIIDENSGKMTHMKYPCIVLDGVACRYSEYYRLCPRAIYHYWREIWLKRIHRAKSDRTPGLVSELCERT